MKEITSAANPIIKKIKSLAIKKYRDREKLFVVEGRGHVQAALAAGWKPDIIAVTKDYIEETEALVIKVPHHLMQKMTGRDNAQDMLGVFYQKTLALPPSDVPGVYVALEDIRDPGNLGTIIRTVHAVGAKGVILVGKTCDFYAPETLRATMGSFAHVPVMRVSAEEFCSWCRRFKGAVIGTHLKAEKDYRSIDYPSSVILVMGGERDGLSKDVAAACDDLVKIPMKGSAESLNLAVSAGVMLYEIV